MFQSSPHFLLSYLHALIAALLILLAWIRPLSSAPWPSVCNFFVITVYGAEGGQRPLDTLLRAHVWTC